MTENRGQKMDGRQRGRNKKYFTTEKTEKKVQSKQMISKYLKLDPLRIKLEKKNKKTFFLDSITHQAFELNKTSEIICKSLLKGITLKELVRNIESYFKNHNKKIILKDIKSFLSFLKTGTFLEKKVNLKSSIPPLKKVTFSITNQCNLRCKHCLAGSTLKNPKELTTEKIKRISKELKKSGCKNVSVFGGEPLIRKDFFEIIKIFKQNNFIIKVNTNGTLIDEKFIKKLNNNDISLFTVSLDGSSDSIQDKLRGNGSFLKTIKGIKLLVSNSNKIIISTTVTKINFKDIFNIAKLAKKLGVYKVRFNDVHFGGNAECFIDELRLNHKHKFEALDIIRKTKKIYGDFVIGSLIDQINILDSIKKNKKSLNFPLTIPPCGAGMGSICIRADGGVTPCEILWDEVSGNIHDASISDIYYLSKKMNNFRMPLLLSENDIKDCIKCNYINACFKGHRCAPYYYPGKNIKDKSRFGCLIK